MHSGWVGVAPVPPLLAPPLLAPPATLLVPPAPLVPPPPTEPLALQAEPQVSVMQLASTTTLF